MLKNETRYGSIIMSEDFLTSLAGYAVSNSFGVVGMADKNAAGVIASLILPDRLSKGIKVHQNEDSVNIDLHIVVSFGTNIATVTSSVAHRIRYVFSEMCDLQVRDVNIFVDDMKV